jgi:transcriptional regulator with XRE-family HTH domain
MQVNKNIVGSKVRRLRRARGMTITDLAMMLGGEGLVLDAQALAAIEDRTRRVRDHEVLALARALQVTVDELLPQRVRKPRV